ncbi:leucine--tRNA ligase [Candidatus Falkowbacteria bacterium CG_4_10_14_0_2_um_filter_36_22]|uniref:Leucine--tRNA ligase n=1 Tax=Candidatus Falkowbacteria bacterium CG02_land_8_20_14_3_00_36_14 TaxID=1974560 RepID=A0A2M7DLR3_9BACT|nr:MAG: leucine--tRNA ligase [Candidatus Falkowbacteria bacterium CG02_land_8_20_14_3_00_36_14]PJA10116.1 MAG: leucine--tRNA ligase [Candidatus Falkowbacteria bacterium CG_4_10_14_0_2_um_filter_36_22]
MPLYNHKKIESKWQKKWEEEGLYKAEDDYKKKKYYLLIEFPYPSGEGLHVGHPRSYTALDILARKKKMEGYNVLYPIGFDAFGLPSENYAIKTGVHPAITTKKNIKTFTKQLKSLGFSFDWSRQVITTDPEYYKWTQWIFLKFYEKGLAYKDKMPINWCIDCKIGLANEEVVDGKCERCGGEVEKREKEQWMLKITAYADRLIKDLGKVDYWERIKSQQINWIGRSEGAEFELSIVIASEAKQSRKDGLTEIVASPSAPRNGISISVYTTRLDTVFGMTYAVIAPEHKLIAKLKNKIANYKEVEKYIIKARNKTELKRVELSKEKTGVELKGIKAINPFNNEAIPLFVADYVLGYYGTGAVMAVPAHDERDFEFAKKYNLPIKQVIKPGKETHQKLSDIIGHEYFIADGILIESGEYSNMKSREAREKMAEWLEKKGMGKKKINYKLRDWVFSRQRYWGEPIPMYHCEKCGIVPASEEEVLNTNKWRLPDIEKYEPTDTGESPLAAITDWVNAKCPKCKSPAKRETDTMPNWAGSSWYFLRYIDPNNKKELADKKKLKYWAPVDWYNGGMEHTTLHLLYSRFWYKFLYDIGVIPKECGAEPYKKRTSHGMILGEGGEKMSKSRGNVINPDEVVDKYGADTFRIYEMFMGPFNQAIPWDTKGVIGVRRFLEKVWKLRERIMNHESGIMNKKIESMLHKTIKKVAEDIENFRFNTAISAMMILANELEKEKEVFIIHYSLFIILLSPFAPHITEDIWSSFAKATEDKAEKKKYEQSIFRQNWPKYDEKLIKDETINLVIQINGKLRDIIAVDADISESKAKAKALASKKIKKWLYGKEVVKIIFVKGKLINIVVKYV